MKFNCTSLILWSLLTVGSFSSALASGTLIVCDDVADVSTLDPQRQFSEKNHTICQQIFDGLVRFDPEGNIQPALAVSWERIDPLTMRFHLRENVRFHNGEPFNAEAVRFTIARYLDPEIGFPAIGFIASLSHVNIIDDHTVDIVTHFPDGLLLNRLAGFILIVPPKYMAAHDAEVLRTKPIGTGAFQFAAWDPGKEIRLVANKNYWLQGYPKLDGLVFRFIPAEEQVRLLLSGEVDLVTELPGTQTLAVETAGNTRVVKQRSFWTMAATMNTDRWPLSDLRVRKALNLAINAQDLIRYDCMGNGLPLASLSVRDQAGHNPELEPYPFDQEKAKQLLKEAGVTDKLVLKAHARAQSERGARIIAAQLAQIGVELQIEAIVSDGEAINSVGTEQWDIGFGGGPDPMCHAFFTQCLLLHSKSPYALQRDTSVDERLMQVMTTIDEEKRLELAREFDRYVHEQALCLFTYQKIKTYGMQRNVSFTPYVSGMPYFFATDIVETAVADVPVRRTVEP